MWRREKTDNTIVRGWLFLACCFPSIYTARKIRFTWIHGCWLSFYASSVSHSLIPFWVCFFRRYILCLSSDVCHTCTMRQQQTAEELNEKGLTLTGAIDALSRWQCCRHWFVKSIDWIELKIREGSKNYYYTLQSATQRLKLTNCFAGRWVVVPLLLSVVWNSILSTQVTVLISINTPLCAHFPCVIVSLCSTFWRLMISIRTFPHWCPRDNWYVRCFFIQWECQVWWPFNLKSTLALPTWWGSR